RPYARSIKQRVVARIMPPWGADPAHGVFKNDPRLSQAEIDTIAAWVDGGAVKGNDADLPKAPQFADGWTIGNPRAVFTMEEDYQISATGVIPYQSLRVPTHLTEDKWIQAIEIRPSASAQVHHVLAYTQPAGQPINQGGALGPTNIGGVTPNKPGLTVPPRVARPLRGDPQLTPRMPHTPHSEA